MTFFYFRIWFHLFIQSRFVSYEMYQIQLRLRLTFFNEILIDSKRESNQNDSIGKAQSFGCSNTILNTVQWASVDFIFRTGKQNWMRTEDCVLFFIFLLFFSSTFEKYKDIQNDQWGMSHFNWTLDGGTNYHILRTGCYPYMKYHCTKRPYQDLSIEDNFFKFIKVVNLGMSKLFLALFVHTWTRLFV